MIKTIFANGKDEFEAIAGLSGRNGDKQVRQEQVPLEFAQTPSPNKDVM